MFGGSGLSLADIAAVTKNNNDGDGFGGNNGWWILIILFALFGWGNGGWGGNGNSNNGGSGNTVVVPVPYGGYALGSGYGASFTDAALQRGFDTQTIISKLDGLNSGVCSLGYDQLAQMNGINTNIMQTGFGLQNSMNQGFNAAATQLADCCCQNRQGQMQIQFDMSQLGCNLQNTMNQNTRDMMQANCLNFRDLGDKIDAGFNRLEMNQLKTENDNLRQQLNVCTMQGIADGAVRTAVQEISPRAVPCYPGVNPTGFGNWSANAVTGFNSNNGGCCWNG